jgi:hypothetical protein
MFVHHTYVICIHPSPYAIWIYTQPVRVRLEDGDLEAAALQASHPLIAPDQHHHHRASASTSSRNGGGKGWQSWAARRMQGRLALEGAHDRSQPKKELFAIVVPFLLRNGSQALITVLRHAAPYSATDKECVVWLSKVLSYCLEMRGGDESMQDLQHRMTALHNEVLRLHGLERKITSLDLDEEALVNDLCGGAPDAIAGGYLGASGEASGVELLVAVFKTVFGGADIRSWDEAEWEQDRERESDQGRDGRGGHGHRDSGGDGANINRPLVRRTTIQSPAGKIVYFVAHSIDSAASSSSSVDARKPSAQVPEARIYATVHHRNFPHFSISIGYGTQELTCNYKLRLSLALKLVDAQDGWRARLVTATGACVRVYVCMCMCMYSPTCMCMCKRSRT